MHVVKKNWYFNYSQKQFNKEKITLKFDLYTNPDASMMSQIYTKHGVCVKRRSI